MKSSKGINHGFLGKTIDVSLHPISAKSKEKHKRIIKESLKSDAVCIFLKDHAGHLGFKN